MQAVAEHGVDATTANEEAPIGINRLWRSDPSRFIVHALNYDYDAEADSFALQRDVPLRIAKPDFRVATARYFSSRETVDLAVDVTEDTVAVTVPTVVAWGFVVLAPSADGLGPSVAERSARAAVESAVDAVARTETVGEEGSPEFVIADENRRAAETALSYDAYGQAEAAANQAVTTAGGSTG